MSRLEKPILWQILLDDAQSNSGLISTVEKMCEHASHLIRLISNERREYTLHNEVHSSNIVKLMGHAIGPHRSEIKPAEAALCIIAAYWHDIGMLNREINVTNISDDHRWPLFKEQYFESDPYLFMRPTDERIITTFIRHTHADRCIDFLNEYEKDNSLIEIGNIPGKELIFEICRSHNKEVTYIEQSETLTRNYEGIDTAFCALLLRLCDLLDFDHTRAPDAAKKYLERKGTFFHNSISDMEWKKHLASRGFTFPLQELNTDYEPILGESDSSRSDEYVLEFAASPKHPEVGKEIDNHLSYIEQQISEIRPVWRKYCRAALAAIPLPSRIDRSGIRPIGYSKGDYRFTLDQSQVLTLISGRQLYGDPFVFIRELIQNSIDTVRHRDFLRTNNAIKRSCCFRRHSPSSYYFMARQKYWYFVDTY